MIAAGPVSFSMPWFCSKWCGIGRGKYQAHGRLWCRRRVPQQKKCQQGRETERGGNNQDATSHGVDHETERQWCYGLRHPRRRTDKTKAIAIILRAEDGER